MKIHSTICIALISVLAACAPRSETRNEVIVYTSVDDVFARPVAERFQQETGIEVKLVPDTEETKSTGLLNRLIAEKNRPQADVFWSGDPVRAAILKSKGISQSYVSPKAEGMTEGFSDSEGHWSALSARARVIIYNTDLVAPGQEPKSIEAFLDAKWKGKACIANPLFGTTSMHAAALFNQLGDAKAKAFFAGLQANEVAMLSSNGEVKRRVSAGDFAFGLTDTDDASVAMKEEKSVGVLYPDQEGMGALIIPNAAVLIADCPNLDNGRAFIDYLLTPEVEQALAESEAVQMPLRPGVSVPDDLTRVEDIKAMQVDYAKLGDILEDLAPGFLKSWVDQN